MRIADHHTYFVGGKAWGWDVWVHNAYKFGSFGEARDFWDGIQRWSKDQNFNASQTKFFWGQVNQARKYAENVEKFYAEVSGLMKAVEEFGHNGRGFTMIARSFGYRAGQRNGIDLVFRQRIGSQVIDHVVEAKGVSMGSRWGKRAIANAVGSEADSLRKLLRAEDEGLGIASALLTRHRAGNVRFYTSFLDGVKTW